jgi:hypothetical protein
MPWPQYFKAHGAVNISLGKAVRRRWTKVVLDPVTGGCLNPIWPRRHPMPTKEQPHHRDLLTYGGEH